MIEFLFYPIGRAARADYWYWLILPYMFAAFVLAVLGQIFLEPAGVRLFLVVLFVLFCVSHTVVAIKRLHDLNMSGWLSTALVLPALAAAAYIGQPDLVDFQALERAPDEVRLVALAIFALVFAPFAYVLGLIWFVMGSDGKNRYGYDPLYR